MYWIREFSATQCFTRVVPNVPNHGLKQIPIVDHITNEDLEDYVAKGLPVVVRKHMEKWPATKSWNDLSYFASVCPNFEHSGVKLPDYIDDLLKIESAIKKRKMDNLPINRTQLQYHVGGYYFSHNEELFHECPRLWEDVQNFSLARHRSSKPSSLLGSFARYLISFFRTEFMSREFLWGDWIQAVTWIGPPTCKTNLHYDDDPMSILYQFKGEKKVRIWSPDQSKYLYPKTSCSENSEYGTRFSRIDDINSENVYKDFPLFQNATALEHILREGEMIYIPSGWWHHVEVLSTSVSVAARSYSLCEGLSYMPNFIVNYVTEQGFFDGSGFCIKPSYL